MKLRHIPVAIYVFGLFDYRDKVVPHKTIKVKADLRDYWENNSLHSYPTVL